MLLKNPKSDIVHEKLIERNQTIEKNKLLHTEEVDALKYEFEKKENLYIKEIEKLKLEIDEKNNIIQGLELFMKKKFFDESIINFYFCSFNYLKYILILFFLETFITSESNKTKVFVEKNTENDITKRNIINSIDTEMNLSLKKTEFSEACDFQMKINNGIN